MQINDILTVGGAAVVVVPLVQVLKAYVAERYVPLLALVVGIVVVVAAALAHIYAQDLGNAVLTGILAGLAAQGLYKVQGGVIVGPKE